MSTSFSIAKVWDAGREDTTAIAATSSSTLGQAMPISAKKTCATLQKHAARKSRSTEPTSHLKEVDQDRVIDGALTRYRCH